MRIAYIISAFKYPEQLLRLISRLNCDTTEFFIHIDQKTDDDIYSRIVDGTRHLPNMHLLKRVCVDWGGFGHVQASLEGIEEIGASDIAFDYTVLLTGQDYPIKTNAQIGEFFGRQHGKSFIDHFPLPAEQWEGGGLQRFQSWHIRWRNRYFLFPKKPNSMLRRKFPKRFRPFGGSSYWCLSNESIQYILRFIRKNPRFVDFFKYVDIPDELFFQTILMNSPLAECLVNDDLRYIEWRDMNSGSPALLGREDFDKIAASPKLFARKFDMSVDSQILDLIDREILARGQGPLPPVDREAHRGDPLRPEHLTKAKSSPETPICY
jgi:hypothetical protein